MKAKGRKRQPLDPRTHWAAEYRRYLRSEEWKALRARVIERDKYCRVCGSPGPIQVHHIFYPTDFWMDTSIEDKTALCGSCHLLYESAKKLDALF